MAVFELNMDGLVGPTHHYAGLAAGNLASTNNALSLSNPQVAALQGLAKMRLLHGLGLKQAVLPPHQRPNLHLLYQLGFNGSAAQQIAKAHQNAPELLSACYSASNMWTANAATVSASLDTDDRRVHFTAANLISNLHRHQEADFSHYLLKYLFSNDRYFQHHPLLPKSTTTGDEGAANHNRLCKNHSSPGVNLFVYGKKGLTTTMTSQEPEKYPARHTLEASQAVVRAHQLDPQRVIFACQNPTAIDQGVFHNDVIGVVNESVLLVHEEAWLQQATIFQEIQRKTDFPVTIIEIKREQLTVTEAVNTYLFNSQLITLPDSSTTQTRMALIAPIECQINERAKTVIDELIADNSNPIVDVHFLDLKQSMRNGGGPACLRLRVPLNENELQAMHQAILINEKLLNELEAWVKRHYRSQLHANDLADPSLVNESLTALDELTRILTLGSIYPFQRETNR
ncbi:N-succinylarginine dihydrolase [Legionella jamestowniensis]|uniref:N-succinylarginine dihydrolase n=1 Tax=Legionella jamestowniensis TaxID=455 RepID=A0A0W0UJN8_9GAMM|nr:N-succinylarginine dihydrolase [Legionella jamestowniensis]KTD08126.1 succinylarginine dihydrolase [Legionella jamestowniensis]OCH97489.1 succinylarginine dihydrolase [Legionella jamestowniensis]SFM08889.1 succinylarginine dihydrolase [Legionella jamestowniensis DSM 19215]